MAAWLASLRTSCSWCDPPPAEGRDTRRALLRYGRAVAVPASLLLALWLLAGEQADQFLFVPVLGVAAVALGEGVPGGLVAAAISTAGCVAIISGQGGTFQALRLTGAGLVSLVVAVAAGALRGAYRRAEVERLAAERLAERLERERAETQRAVQLRDQVLAVVSHDLRSPLASIVIAADRLERRFGATVPEARRHAESIRNRAEGMSRLIHDLLDVASIEAGRLGIRCRPEDPARIAQDAVDAIALLAGERGLRLAVRAPESLPPLECDRDRLLQVLSNLLGNAVKIVPAGGAVTVEVESSGDEVRFVVSDSGPGIAPEDLPHVFDRFRRGGAVEYSGAGLGLAIAKGIVDAHRGRIAAESAPGEGARFTVTLPGRGRSGDPSADSATR